MTLVVAPLPHRWQVNEYLSVYAGSSVPGSLGWCRGCDQDLPSWTRPFGHFAWTFSLRHFPENFPQTFLLHIPLGCSSSDILAWYSPLDIFFQTFSLDISSRTFSLDTFSQIFLLRHSPGHSPSDVPLWTFPWTYSFEHSRKFSLDIPLGHFLWTLPLRRSTSDIPPRHSPSDIPLGHSPSDTSQTFPLGHSFSYISPWTFPQGYFPTHIPPQTFQHFLEIHIFCGYFPLSTTA